MDSQGIVVHIMRYSFVRYMLSMDVDSTSVWQKAVLLLQVYSSSRLLVRYTTMVHRHQTRKIVSAWVHTSSSGTQYRKPRRKIFHIMISSELLIQIIQMITSSESLTSRKSSEAISSSSHRNSVYPSRQKGDLSSFSRLCSDDSLMGESIYFCILPKLSSDIRLKKRCKYDMSCFCW